MPAAHPALLGGVVMALLLMCSGPAAGRVQPARDELPYQVLPGHLIMKMRSDFVAAMDTDRQGLRYSRPAGSRAGVYAITDGKSVNQKIKELQQHPAIEYVEPDYRVPVNWVPNDSLLKVQWHHGAIGSAEAWNASTGRQEVKVCHIDSGVRTDHPDLAGRVLKGWNLVPEIQDFDQDSPSPGSPYYLNINDSYGHGTHTAGIIAAVGNNMLGVAGIAMDVRLLVCRFIWDDGFGSISDALECLRLCKEEGAVVSSNSWGGVPHSKLIEEALQEIEEAGMLFVVASGNQGQNLDARPSFPASASMENILVVGASSAEDQASNFSNVGKGTVHMLAPGEQILSTTYNGWYGPMDGTSMACPLVAGAAALLHSAALRQGVELTYSEKKQLLLSAVEASPEQSAGATVTGGRLNVRRAMAALALLLNDRGQGEIPGDWLVEDGKEELRRQLLQNKWGQALFEGEGSATPQAVSAEALAGQSVPAEVAATGEQAAAAAVQVQAQAQAKQTRDAPVQPKRPAIGRRARRRALRQRAHH